MLSMKNKKQRANLDQQALDKIAQERTFNSPTWGSLTFKEVIYKMGVFMRAKPTSTYQVVIGTDSHAYQNGVVFVSAIIVHRHGGGAIYFWAREVDKTTRWVLQTRMHEEAARSMTLTRQFMDEFDTEGITQFATEIHVDIGSKGKTRELINEVVGMIEGSGFAVKTKPQAFGAASVADRHT